MPWWHPTDMIEYKSTNVTNLKYTYKCLLNYAGKHSVLIRILHLHTLLHCCLDTSVPYKWKSAQKLSLHEILPLQLNHTLSNHTGLWPQNLLWAMQLANCFYQFHFKDVRSCFSCLLKSFMGVLLARLLATTESQSLSVCFSLKISVKEICGICHHNKWLAN